MLIARDVSLTYRTRTGVIEALSGLSLRIERGEFVAIVGPSGCGKSTLLKMTAGLVPPTSGEIALGGTPIAGPRREVGIVFQKPTLLPWKTVLENVLLPARALGLEIGAARARAMELLDLVGLGGFAQNHPRELSGGMQQRVGLARMLIHDPELLLMDEPFAALDAMTREMLALELQRILASGERSVLFITHSIPEAVFVADRVLVMSSRPGRILEELDVPIPRPRELSTMADPRFIALCDHLRQRFNRSALEEAAR
jgi:NitT/TauT family transport system ATP-binding protein